MNGPPYSPRWREEDLFADPHEHARRAARAKWERAKRPCVVYDPSVPHGVAP